MNYITIPGYAYPIEAKFDPKTIDVSSGEPIVRVPEGFFVWGRGCTQPGGGIVPAWGFVRTGPTGTGASPAGLGAASSSSSATPAIIAGVAILAGLVGVLVLAGRGHAKTVDQEALELFPRGGAPTAQLPRGRKALNYGRAAARCFYVELRQTHPPAEAASIARRALDRERAQLTAMSHVGKSVQSGCTLLLETHAPREYYR